MSQSHSEQWRSLYDEDFLLEVFGDLEPSLPVRTQYFFEQWLKWRNTRIKLKQQVKVTVIKRKLRDIGLFELRDFQIKNREVRFCNNELKAFALISGLQDFSETGNV